MDDAAAADDLGHDRTPLAGASRWQRVVGVLGLGVVAWVGADLLHVVTGGSGGPGRHGSGGEPPAEVEDRGPSPSTTSPHDPSQFDH